MARNASSQFSFLSQAEARAYLAKFEGEFPAMTKDGMTHGDRIAAQRRVDFVTTAEEREASRRFNRAHPFTMRPWE
jgi:hypothetical protein